MRIILPLILFLTPAFLHAQDSTSIEQYCIMKVMLMPLTSKVTVKMDAKEQRKLLETNNEKETGNVKPKNFESITDALNHLGMQGWKLFKIVRIEDDWYNYHYYFKKSVKPANLE